LEHYLDDESKFMLSNQSFNSFDNANKQVSSFKKKIKEMYLQQCGKVLALFHHQVIVTCAVQQIKETVATDWYELRILW
jgi:hypothetical protein